MAQAMAFKIGLLVFPDIMQLDMTGPHEVFSHFPDSEVLLVSKSLDPVRSSGGNPDSPGHHLYRTVRSSISFACRVARGMNALLTDGETLDFLRRQAQGARYVTSVCTGSLVLGAAGLLKGRRAACHWMSREMLSAFGAIPDPSRVVVDGNIVSGGGVTAGIDFALTVAGELFGADVAKSIQLAIEYNPQPPFDAGSPEGAGPEIEAAARSAASGRQSRRAAAVRAAAEAVRERS